MIKPTQYTHFNDFFLRTPSQNFEPTDFLHLGPQTLIEYFQTNTFFREGIFVASPTLYNEILKEIENNHISQKVVFSLAKYYLRSKTRATPFGLFAGCTVGKIGQVTEMILNTKTQYRKHIRVDMELVSKLTHYFSFVPEIQKQIHYFPNNTLYKVTDFYSYIESKIENNKKVYSKSTTAYNEYLSDLLSFCKHEEKLLEDIIGFLEDIGFKKEESSEYIRSLIDNQILMSSLDTSTIDPNPFATLINQLHSFRVKDDSLQYFITESQKVLDSFENENPPDFIDNLKTSESVFQSFHDGVRNIFQTDLELSTHRCELSVNVAKKILKAIPVLNKLSPFPEPPIQQFKKRFYKKYEEEEVPLLKVLDDDFGLGYPYIEDKLFVPLLKGINFTEKKEDKKITWNKKDSLLSQKLSSFFIHNTNYKNKYIEISDEDLDFPDGVNELNLPKTLSAIVEVYRSTKDFVYISSFTASATNLVGRFSYFNESINNSIKNIIKKEEEFLNTDTLFAEIVHLPESREGNVILRPQFTEYEIPILSKSLLPLEKQIHLEDLFLRMENNQLILRSKRLNRKIIPRLSSSHFYAHPKNLPLYKFLADLQYQDTMRNIYFDWGILGKEFTFLPRVVYKDMILSKAYWNVSLKDIHFLTSTKEKGEACNKLKDWRERNHIPDTIVIKEMDNKLYIDFNSDLLVDLFFDTIKNKKTLQLEEFLYNNENGIINNTEKQSFVGELIINYYQNLC